MKKRLWILVLLLWVAGCAQKSGEGTVYPRPKSIAVLPFEAACPGGETGYFSCPVRELIAGEIAPQAPQVMDELLRAILSGRPGFRLVSRGEFEGLWERALAEVHNPTPAEIVKALGQELGTEAILYGKIFRFRERKGRGYAVESPASVAFALVLFETRSGRILWKGWFDETQAPLNQNLLKIRLYGGVRWLTAKELARKGLEKILKDFPFPEGT